MKTYQYYQDVKTTVWERKFFTVTAQNKTEADEIAGRCVNGNVSEVADGRVLVLLADETLYDTMGVMSVEENHGDPTIEVFRRPDHKFIADNRKNQ